jgi:hypothetical protein
MMREVSQLVATFHAIESSWSAYSACCQGPSCFP